MLRSSRFVVEVCFADGLIHRLGATWERRQVQQRQHLSLLAIQQSDPARQPAQQLALLPHHEHLSINLDTPPTQSVVAQQIVHQLEVAQCTTPWRLERKEQSSKASHRKHGLDNNGCGQRTVLCFKNLWQDQQ